MFSANKSINNLSTGLKVVDKSVNNLSAELKVVDNIARSEGTSVRHK